jgi:malonate transporter
MTTLILSAFIPVFAVIAFGYFIRATNWMPGDYWRGINALTYRVLFPAVVLITLARADLGAPGTGRIALAAFGLTAASAVLAFIAGRVFARGGQVRASLVAVAACWNVIFFLAVSDRLFGEAAGSGPAAIVAAGLVTCSAAAALSFALARDGNLRAALKPVSRDPVLLACVAGAALGLFAPPLPEVVQAPIGIVGSGAMSVILLSIGAGLRFSALRGRVAILFLGAGLRVVAPAALALVVARLAGFTPEQGALLVLALSAPAAAYIYAMADAFDGERELTAGMITLSVLISAAVLPFAVGIALSL